MISIITVNWNSYDFLYLLVESLERFTKLPYELIVIDNSDKKLKIVQPHVHQFFMGANIGHGRGLNHGVAKSLELFPKHPFTMFLDVDTHMLTHNWDLHFINSMKTYDLIGGKGVPAKPIRPACMFMKQALSRYDWCDSTGYKGVRVTPEGFDVAIKAYYKIMADGFKIAFLEPTKSNYNTINGENFCYNGIPLVYHHWSGTWLNVRQQDFPNDDLMADKNKLFDSIPWRLP